MVENNIMPHTDNLEAGDDRRRKLFARDFSEVWEKLLRATRRSGLRLRLPALLVPKLKRIKALQPQGITPTARNQSARNQELDSSFFLLKSLLAKRLEKVPTTPLLRLMSKEQDEAEGNRATKDGKK